LGTLRVVAAVAVAVEPALTAPEGVAAYRSDQALGAKWVVLGRVWGAGHKGAAGQPAWPRPNDVAGRPPPARAAEESWRAWLGKCGQGGVALAGCSGGARAGYALALYPAGSGPSPAAGSSKPLWV